MEIYSTRFGFVAQNFLERKLELNFSNRTIKMCITDFLLQRSRINAINIESLLFDLSDSVDYFRFSLPKSSIVIDITISELIQLKELLNGAMYMLELHTILEKSGISVDSIEETQFVVL